MANAASFAPHPLFAICPDRARSHSVLASLVVRPGAVDGAGAGAVGRERLLSQQSVRAAGAERVGSSRRVARAGRDGLATAVPLGRFAALLRRRRRLAL